MKLSKAQLLALRLVEKGQIRKWYSVRFSGSDRIEGTGKKTIEVLVRNGLVYLDYTGKKIGNFNPFDYYRLTDAGRAALEEGRKMSDARKTMTQDELTTIRTIMGQTTPGDWYAYEEKNGDEFGIKSFDGGKKVVPVRNHSNQWNYSYEGIPRKEDAIFLAMSKKIVGRLLDEVEHLNKVSRYLAERLVLPGPAGRAYYGGEYGAYATKDEAAQSWLDEANREVSDAE